MKEDPKAPIADKRLLDAMKAVNPSLEKLMADRLALRRGMNQALDELERVRRHAIPEYIGIVKTIVLIAATLALAALSAALFKGFFEVRTTTTLFIAVLLPIWIVDRAEARFGRWVLHRNGRAEYVEKPLPVDL